MSTTLDRIIEEVRGLPVGEQRRLVEQLKTIVPATPSEDELEDAFEREMAAEGIISLPDSSAEAHDDDDDWEPVEITGEPISEMVIRERR